jgi:probable HAF family extracellular repeat protein
MRRSAHIGHRQIEGERGGGRWRPGVAASLAAIMAIVAGVGLLAAVVDGRAETARSQAPGSLHRVSDRSSAETRWLMRPLGTDDAVAINERGEVAGNGSAITSPSHALLWRKGRLHDLGTLGGEGSEVPVPDLWIFRLQPGADVINTRSGERAPVDARVAFAVTGGRADAIAVRRLGGGPTKLVVRLPDAGGKRVRLVSMVWGGEESRIAFSDSVGRVFVVGADGRGLRRLAAFAGRQVRVDDWSADGRTLAVDTTLPYSRTWCHRGNLPGLYLIDADTQRVRRMPVYPGHTGDLRRLRRDDPAELESVAFSPDGANLVYIWWQYEALDCRNNWARKVVATIGTDGHRLKRLFESPETLVGVRWSPTGRSLALMINCDSSDPFSWIGSDDSEFVIAVAEAGCEVGALDRQGRILPGGFLDPTGYGQVLYSINRGNVRVLRKLEGTSIARDYGLYWMIGVLPHGQGIIAGFGAPDGIGLIPLDGSKVRSFPRLVAPSGMRVGEITTLGT